MIKRNLDLLFLKTLASFTSMKVLLLSIDHGGSLSRQTIPLFG